MECAVLGYSTGRSINRVESLNVAGIKMAAFKYSLQPWIDDRGQTLPLTTVGRGVDVNATIVSLYHDWETDSYLYGYWGNEIFGKVFVTEVRCARDPDPTWEIQVGPLHYDPARSVAPSAEERAVCIAQVIDALSQWPEGDASKAGAGRAVRRIEIKTLAGRDIGR